MNDGNIIPSIQMKLFVRIFPELKFYIVIIDDNWQHEERNTNSSCTVFCFSLAKCSFESCSWGTLNENFDDMYF